VTGQWWEPKQPWNGKSSSIVFQQILAAFDDLEVRPRSVARPASQSNQETGTDVVGRAEVHAEPFAADLDPRSQRVPIRMGG
jgi:hypothetical protein